MVPTVAPHSQIQGSLTCSSSCGFMLDEESCHVSSRAPTRLLMLMIFWSMRDLRLFCYFDSCEIIIEPSFQKDNSASDDLILTSRFWSHVKTSLALSYSRG